MNKTYDSFFNPLDDESLRLSATEVTMNTILDLNWFKAWYIVLCHRMCEICRSCKQFKENLQALEGIAST